MRTVAILGAGDLGATLARLLAEREVARRVFLVDPDDGRARGKALDVMQSGPVDAFDVRVEGCATLELAGACDLVIVADHPALDQDPVSPGRATEWTRDVASRLGPATLLVARAGAAPLLEAALAHGVARDRLLGSAPLAFAAGVRRRIAAELKTSAREVAVLAMGAPPAHAIVPRECATVSGVPVERLSPTALRRALESAARGAAGPFALAAAAARVASVLARAHPVLLSVTAVLQGEYGHRGIALAVPARVGAGRVQEVVEITLDPVDRIAFDNAASRRR
jgi:malate dehydrogenase